MLAATAGAGVNQWTPLGPVQEHLTKRYVSLVIDPSDPDVLWLSTIGTPSLWRSSDRGATWTGFPTLLLAGPIHVDEANPAHILALGPFSLYQSFDGGATWSKHSFDPTIVYGSEKSMAVSRNTRTIYVGVEESCDGNYVQPIFYRDCDGGGVTRSTDGGRTWSRAGLSGQTVRILGVDPFDPDIAYALGNDYEKVGRGIVTTSVFRTRNGGRDWTPIGPPVTIDLTHPSYGALRFPDVSLLIDPAVPSRLYLSADFGLATSSDGGSNWTVLQSEAPFRSIRSLSVDPLYPTTLYAATPGRSGSAPLPDELVGVLRSTDQGHTWSRLIAPEIPLVASIALPQSATFGQLAVDPRGVYYLRAAAGVFSFTPSWPRRRTSGR